MTDHERYDRIPDTLSWEECADILTGTLPDPLRYNLGFGMDMITWEGIWYGKAAETVRKTEDRKLESVALLTFAMLDCHIDGYARRYCGEELAKMSRQSCIIVAYTLSFCEQRDCSELGATLLTESQLTLGVHRVLWLLMSRDLRHCPSVLMESVRECSPDAARLVAERLRGAPDEEARSQAAEFLAKYPANTGTAVSLPPIESWMGVGMLLEMACMSPSPAVRLQAAKAVLGVDLAPDLLMAVIGALQQTGTAEIRALAMEQLATRSQELHRRFSERHSRRLKQELIHRIRLFKRGVICPTEMWLPLCENLAPGDVKEFLNRLDDELQALILEEYQGLASYRFLPAWYGQRPTPMQETIMAIKEWCQRQLES